MSEHDDSLSRRYRELAREEPPASLDAAVLAAARQAVQPRARSRWMGPVAVAAVLVLGLGIALRMQVEQPGIETATPAPSSSAEYPLAPPPADEAPVAAERATPAPVPAPASTPKAPVRKELLADKPSPATATAPPPVTAAAPPAEPAAAPPAASASAPRQEAAPMQSMTAPEPRAQAKLGIAAEGIAPQRAKRAEPAVAADAAAPARDAREVELERIARLRAEGRHGEADRAIEEFRRRHPDYRIAEAMWERIRPR